MADSTSETSRPPGRPPDTSVRERVVAATLAALAERPYDGVTVDEVAKSAGVSKATIYRRWPTKVDIIVESLLSTPPLVIHDSGVLLDDLLELARQLFDVSRAMPLAGLLSALSSPADLSAASREIIAELFARRSEPFAVAVEKARSRGEVADDVDTEIAVRTIGAIVTSAILLPQEAVVDDVAPQIGLVVRGMTAARQ